MVLTKRSLALLLILPLTASLTASLAACGDDDDGGAADAGPPDAAPMPDANGACPEPTIVLPYEWRPIDLASTGIVTTSVAGGITTATIDATAGGTTAAGENPYVYVDLDTGTRVDISDVDSYSSTAWDLGLKRMVIRVNGGDSGIGGVEAATVAGAASLAEVTAEPAASSFVQDDWATADCMLAAGPLGEPSTAIGEWYDYDVNTHVLTAKSNVYVVRTRAGTLIKLRVVTYYGDPASPMRGAYYELEWAPL